MAALSRGERGSSREERIALALVAGSLAAHLALAGAVGLSPQEAYYWEYARHLALSYFDHPPLAAWTIRAATELFGDSERAIRLAALFHGAVFAAFFLLAGRRLFGPRAALLATIALLLTPLFSLGQIVITPDGPLLAGWAAALYFTARALDEERGAWLLLAGAAVGWATLGKYTGFLLAPQVGLALLLDPRGRRLLRSPWPWLGLALAVALFSPVIVWNASHAWISFGFQVGVRVTTATTFTPRRLWSHLGLQAIALTPFLWAGAWAAAVVAARRFREPSYRLCAVFSLPGLLLFLAVSPFVWVKGNWPAAAYPSALLAAAALVVEPPGRLHRLAMVSLWIAAAGSLYVHLALLVPALPFPARDDPTSGWKELAARVEAEQARIAGPSFVLGCTYKPASELAYYLPGRPRTYGQSAMGEAGLQYGYWFERDGIAGREGIVVLDGREWKNCLRKEEFCRPLVELEPLTVRRGSRPVTTFRLFRCRYVEPSP